MARSDPRSKIEDYYRRVADVLILQIERGTAPWTEAWKPDQRALPYNIRTGKSYMGGNSVWLASTAIQRNYSDERWGTYKQIKDVGGQVRRGEKGTAILFWQFETKKLARDDQGHPLLDDQGRPVYEVRPLPSPRVYQYTVFNAEQCDGLPPRPRRQRSYQWDSHEDADRLFERLGAVIEHTGDDRSYYDLRRDRIVLPPREWFPTGPKYYQAALHEFGHWTGHPNRLDRHTLIHGLEAGFGSDDYAREELRAEICSMMTGDRLQIGHDPTRHASYVGSWIKRLEEDPKEIYRASRDAQEMSDYLLERGRSREHGRADQLDTRGSVRLADRPDRGEAPKPSGKPRPVPGPPAHLPWPDRPVSRNRFSGPAR